MFLAGLVTGMAFTFGLRVVVDAVVFGNKR
jgi:hypothetical protein